MPRKEFEEEVKAYKNRKDKYLVYFGYSKKDKEHSKVIYVGTTIQYPMSRWYYHSIHGKDLDFVEAFRFDNEEEMLAKEFELIQKYRPSCNKITKRPQNFNAPLTAEQLKERIGSPEWCQSCLTRRVNKGYAICYWCQQELKGGNK